MTLEMTKEELRLLSGQILSRLRQNGGTEFLGGGETERPGSSYMNEAFSRRRAAETDSADEKWAEALNFLEMGEARRQPLPGAEISPGSYSALGYVPPAERLGERGVEALSDYLRRDSRRYDGVLEKY